MFTKDGLLSAQLAVNPWPAIQDGRLQSPPPEHLLDHLMRRDVLDGCEQAEVQVELLTRPDAGTVAVVLGNELPACDICRHEGRSRLAARYDGPVRRNGRGPWAFMCPDCYILYSSRLLGVGFGQYLLIRNEIPHAVREAFLRAKAYWRDRGVAVPSHDPF